MVSSPFMSFELKVESEWIFVEENEMIIDFKPFYCVLISNKFGFRSTQIVFLQNRFIATVHFEMKTCDKILSNLCKFPSSFDFNVLIFLPLMLMGIHPALCSHLRGFYLTNFTIRTECLLCLSFKWHQRKIRKEKIKVRATNVVKLHHHKTWHQSSTQTVNVHKLSK